MDRLKNRLERGECTNVAGVAQKRKAFGDELRRNLLKVVVMWVSQSLIFLTSLETLVHVLNCLVDHPPLVWTESEPIPGGVIHYAAQKSTYLMIQRANWRTLIWPARPGTAEASSRRRANEPT